jgi:hypothetical protein
MCHWAASIAVTAAGLLGGIGVVQATDPVYVLDINKQNAKGMTLSQSDSLQTNLDTYAKSARLPVLRGGTGGELRLWVTVATFNARTEGIETMGYVYSGDHSSVCRIKGPVAKTGHAGQQRVCRLDRHASRGGDIGNEIKSIAALSGMQFDCGVLDGYWVEIDGISNGNHFALEAGNPDSCSDDGSKLIAKVLANF